MTKIRHLNVFGIHNTTGSSQHIIQQYELTEDQTNEKVLKKFDEAVQNQGIFYIFSALEYHSINMNDYSQLRFKIYEKNQIPPTKENPYGEPNG